MANKFGWNRPPSFGAVFLNRLSINVYLYAMAKKPTRPRDANQLAKSIVDIATGEAKEDKVDPAVDQLKVAAAALGRLGGLKGGKARAAKLSPKKRSEIAKKAAAARWHKS